jgi:hypothetical protein
VSRPIEYWCEDFEGFVMMRARRPGYTPDRDVWARRSMPDAWAVSLSQSWGAIIEFSRRLHVMVDEHEIAQALAAYRGYE